MAVKVQRDHEDGPIATFDEDARKWVSDDRLFARTLNALLPEYWPSEPSTPLLGGWVLYKLRHAYPLKGWLRVLEAESDEIGAENAVH